MDNGEEISAKIDLKGAVKAFLKTTATAIIITDVRGIILWCNDRVAEIYEEPITDILGTHITERVVYSEGFKANDNLRHALEHGYTELSESRLITKAYKEIFVNHQLYRLNDKRGNHFGFWVIAHELTKEKKSIEESKAAIKVLNEMREEEIKKKQLEVIEMIKGQSEVLCPAKDLRDTDCPAVLAVEAAIQKSGPALSTLFTNTELTVAKYVRQNMSIKDISEKMCISERTVKNHRYSIRKKLNISRSSVPLGKYLQGFKI